MKKLKAAVKKGKRVAVTLRGDHLDFIKEVAKAALVKPEEVLSVLIVLETLKFRRKPEATNAKT